MRIFAVSKQGYFRKTKLRKLTLIVLNYFSKKNQERNEHESFRMIKMLIFLLIETQTDPRTSPVFLVDMSRTDLKK